MSTLPAPLRGEAGALAPPASERGVQVRDSSSAYASPCIRRRSTPRWPRDPTDRPTGVSASCRPTAATPIPSCPGPVASTAWSMRPSGSRAPVRATAVVIARRADRRSARRCARARRPPGQPATRARDRNRNRRATGHGLPREPPLRFVRTDTISHLARQAVANMDEPAGHPSGQPRMPR